MLLTIGMIVKDEEKYLGSCLEALRPILKKVDSELIIVDTGSTDSTVDIAKRYTNKVFHFEWCDDFAAARNAAMKRAKGKWYMSIDADEIIEDAQGIIDFFNSGEYKKYNAASYIIRSSNYADLNASTDFNALRLINIKDDSYYVNAVHERFENIYTPIKFLSVVAKHYGYVTENNEEHIKHKMDRNLKIMLRELEKNPSDGMMYFNICNAYKLLKENEKALEYCIKGLEIAKKQNDSVKYIIYARLIEIYFESGEYLKAINLADEYFNSKSDRIGTDIDIYLLRAESLYQLGKYREAIPSYKCYLEAFSEFKKGRLNTPDTLMHPVNYVADKDFITGTLKLAKSYFETGEYIKAKEYLNTIPAGDYHKDKVILSFWLNLEVGVMHKTDGLSELVPLYLKLDDHSKKSIQEHIEKILQENRDKILEEFAAIDNNDDKYCELMKLRKSFYEGKLTAFDIMSFLEDLEEISFEYADIVYFALKKDLDVNILNIDAYNIEKCFYNNFYFHFDDLTELLYKKFESSADGFSINSKLWISMVFYRELISGNLKEEDLENYFSAYSKLSFSAIGDIFKEELIREQNLRLMPKSFRMGYYCYHAVKAAERGDTKENIRYLRKALKSDERLKDTIKKLSERIEKKLKSKDKIMSEYEALARQAKQAIAKLIDEGKAMEAEQFLHEYEKLNPKDPDIPNIKKKLSLAQYT
ncbi:MAG: glycosyltransferase [Clostridiales bacterium]|jgi:glycosyltransferase involved in cell wall biosynthesis|nr:glycosyltransferase [Clostridiales bacterium]